MKKILIALSFLVLVATLYFMLPCESSLFAQSECCKHRASLRASWARTPESFESCKRANDQTDGDNVLTRGISMVGLELLIGQVRGLRGSALASLDGQRLVALVYLAARKTSPWVASLF